MEKYQETWAKCLAFIKPRVSEQSFKTWFFPIRPINYEDHTLTLQVNQVTYEWLEEYYVDLLREVIQKYLGSEGRLAYSISIAPPSPLAHAKGAKKSKVEGPQTPLFTNNLHPGYTFSNFIEGGSNQLAKAVASAVAKNPGNTSFNPFFLYSEPGLGKSHLVQSIAHKVAEKFGENKVAYLSAQAFTSGFIDALRKDQLKRFIGNFVNKQLLVIEDIQFLSGKEKTQEIFYDLFNHLHQHNRQIVMTSDCRPSALVGLERRLLSRFKWGVTADIQKPSLELRMAIIDSKLKGQRANIPENIRQYIAASVRTNIRDLEGVLHSLMAQLKYNKRAISLNLVKHVLEDIVAEVNTEVTIDYLKKLVANYFKISVEEIDGKSRKREIVTARQVAMHLCKEYTHHSLKFIGAQFGGKDHSTVIYALRSVNDQCHTDGYFNTHFQEVKSLVKKNIPSAVS